MKCNVATFLLELPKRYRCRFLENDINAEKCCLENILVSRSERLGISMGKNTIYKISGECNPRANYFQRQRGDGA